VFALASMLIGLAPAGWWLIAARGVLGAGQGLAFALLTSVKLFS
jgi:hypothetical protein